MIACGNSGHPENDHFSHVGKMVQLGSGAQRKTKDYKLSRYACYLIVQNADSRKSVIANGQTYFAVQTRRKELEDNSGFQQLSENQKRLMLRNELAEHNKDLAAAKDAGVESGLDYAIPQNHGYKGLYGGLDNKAIHKQKKLKKSHKILDHMGSTELAANLFRATQTEEQLKRDAIQNKRQANQTHHEVGAKVRQTIADLGEPCQKTCPYPTKALNNWSGSRRHLKGRRNMIKQPFPAPSVYGDSAYLGFHECGHGFPRGSMGTSKQWLLEAKMDGYLKEFGYVA